MRSWQACALLTATLSLVTAPVGAQGAQGLPPPEPEPAPASAPTSPPPTAAAPATPTTSSAPTPSAPTETAPEPMPPAPPPSAADQPPPPPPPPAEYGAYGGRAQAGASYDAQGEREPEERGRASEKHELSIRLDPFNWLIEGRLGLELEVSVWKFISVEMIPILVANDDPPAVNYSGFEHGLRQHSNGLGPISGASLGAGFWLQGTPFSGYVLRLYVTNYAYTYDARDGAGVVDRVNFVERRIVGFFGSHSRFGPFTIAGGFGLGYELNQAERCGFTEVASNNSIGALHTGCDGEQQIRLSRSTTGSVHDLNGPLHPVYLEARFSLGFVFGI